MPIAVQTPTGTMYMEIDEFLRLTDEDFSGLFASNEIDPLTVKIPANTRDITDEFDLPDIPHAEDIQDRPSKKRK